MPESIRPRVLYVQYGNPAAYPPIVHGARILASAGWDVVVCGTAAGDDPIVFESHANIQTMVRPSVPPGLGQKVHYARFMAAVVRFARSWRPGWAYISDPLAAPIGLLLRRLGIRVVYHEHDSPPVARSSSAGIQALVLGARTRLARRADLVVLPNATRAAMVGEVTGRTDVMTIWNCPSLTEVSRPRAIENPHALRVLYHGSIVPARLPLAVIDALARVPDLVTLRVIGYETIGHPRYGQELRERARALGVLGRVTFVDALPRGALMESCARCDVGLALLPAETTDINERHMIGASNKAFDYLAGGLPLLVGRLPDWKVAYVDSGLGLSCDPERATTVATALQWYLDHPSERLAMGECGRQRILADWNYEKAFGPVLDRMLIPGAAAAVRDARLGEAPSQPGGRIPVRDRARSH